MLAIRVGDDVHELSESSAADLIGRIQRPALEGDDSVAGSVQDKLRGALHRAEPATFDPGELAVLGAVIESWATEMGVDAADVQELRDAIAEHLR